MLIIGRSLIFIAAAFLISCGGRVGSPTSSSQTIEKLGESVFIKISNNSTASQLSCSQTNSIQIQVSIPSGQKVFCRDQSKLMSSIPLGKTCEGGVEVKEFAVDSQIVECQKLKVCGKSASSVDVKAEQFDGTPILQLSFTELPWGCDGLVEISNDSDFRSLADNIKFSVTAPVCRFCTRTQMVTCGECIPVQSDEQVVSGQVIPKTCIGGCKDCKIDASASKKHSETWLYYSRQLPQCGQPCSQISQVRVCNNGVWTGDEKFAFSQCKDISDSSCVCQNPADGSDVPGNSALKTFYKSNPSECETKCSDASQNVQIQCKSGVWVDSASNPYSDNILSQYRLTNCSDSNTSCPVPTPQPEAAAVPNLKVTAAPTSTFSPTSFFEKLFSQKTGDSCTAGSTSVANGSSYLFYSNSSGSCSKKCSTITLLRTCKDGAFEGDPSFSYPTCKDVPCGCYLASDGKTYDSGDSVDINKLERPSCGHTCADTDQTVKIKCSAGVWLDKDNKTVTEALFSQYPYTQTMCTNPVCDCQRLGRLTIPEDGKAHDVHSVNVPACPSTCSQKKGSVTCKSGVLTGDTGFPYDIGQCSDPICACTVPLDGGKSLVLAENGSARIYKVGSNTPAQPSACKQANISMLVTCNLSHVLVPSYDNTIFKYDECKESDYSCRVNGYGISYGTSMSFSKTNSPACGVACETIKVFCDNGTLVKDSDHSKSVTLDEMAPYANSDSCQPKDCDCRVNGYVLPYLGAGKDFYSIPKGQGCNPQSCSDSKVTLSCDKDQKVVGGDPTKFTYASCAPPTCDCPLPTGGSILDGKGQKLFAVDSATCSDRGACDKAENFQQLYCAGGQMTPASYDQTKFKFSSCQPALCTCSVNGVEVGFGNDVWFYKKETVAAPGSCGQNAAKFKCNSGGSVVAYTGENISEYPFIKCSSPTDQGDLGGTGGGTGNDEGPGSAIKKRAGVSDGGPGGKLCIDGVTCTAREDQFVSLQKMERQSCQLPWGTGEVEFYGSIIAFDTSCVVKPGRCFAHRSIRTCAFPNWTGDKKYKFGSCEEKISCP